MEMRDLLQRRKSEGIFRVLCI